MNINEKKQNVLFGAWIISMLLHEEFLLIAIKNASTSINCNLSHWMLDI